MAIDIRWFGLAWGATTALLYLVCVLVMSTVPVGTQALFFNSLLHGIDVRRSVPGRACSCGTAAGYRKMVQNLWRAAGYNVFAIPLTARVLAEQASCYRLRSQPY